jgi:hypothetical protein
MVRNAAARGFGTGAIIFSSAARTAGPDTRMTARPARPGALDSAKIVEVSVIPFAYS